LKKLVTILCALTMLAIVLTPVGANGVQVYLNMNKPQYEPGEKGTIYITIRNGLDKPLQIKNVTVEFTSWKILTKDGWDPLGNQTIIYADKIIPALQTAALNDITFTVPTDGRASTTPLRIRIYTSEYPIDITDTIWVVDAYNQRVLKAMDNIVLLLTVVAILAIISAVIIAAAVFLSGRKPGVTWQKEG